MQITQRYAHSLARFLVQQPANDSKQYLLLPIPASKHRRDTYGFNQCALLCEAMIPFLDTRFLYRSNILHRHEGSVSQTKLRRTERHSNVKDVFEVSASLHNKHVIIIDDVWTTGATINNARLALLESGAQSVVAFTIAH